MNLLAHVLCMVLGTYTYQMFVETQCQVDPMFFKRKSRIVVMSLSMVCVFKQRSDN